MERLLPIVWLAGAACFLVTLAGYYAGIEVWLGWGFIPAFVIMIVAFAFRDLGGLFLSVVGFFGMWKGWDWPFLQAFLVAFPSVALLIIMMLGGGITHAISSRRSSPQR